MYQHCTVTYSAIFQKKIPQIPDIPLCQPLTDYPLSDFLYRHILRHETHPLNRSDRSFHPKHQTPKFQELLWEYAKPQYLCNEAVDIAPPAKYAFFKKTESGGGRMNRTTKTIAKSTKHTGRPFRGKKNEQPQNSPMTLPLETPRSDDRL